MDYFSFPYQVDLYGEDLFYHLKGWSNEMQEFVSANNQFPYICSVTIISAIISFAVFYYLLNHPRFNRLWHWFLVMVLLVLGIFGWSWQLVLADLSGVSDHPVSPFLNISENNAFMFGIYNAFLSAVYFFAFSILGRFGSKNCKNTPWKSLFNWK